MTPDSPTPRRPRRMLRVPPFYPAPTRTRRRKVTPPGLEIRAFEGLIHLVAFRGRYRRSWVRPDDSALEQLARRLDRTAGRVTR